MIRRFFSFGDSRRPRSLWVGIALALGLVLAACASPRSDYPRIDLEAEEAARGTLLTKIVTERLRRQARLQTLAWPVLRENRPLCGSKVQYRIGWIQGEAEDIATLVGGLRPVHVRRALEIDGPTIVHVVPEAPAAKAGVRIGDRLVAVEGIALPSSRAWRAFSRKLKNGSTLSVRVADRKGTERQIEIVPEEICGTPVRLDPSTAYGAYTDGSTLWMTSGMVRDLEDDRLIQFVLGHELGHAIGRHPRKIIRNYVVSGGIVLVPVVSIVGVVTDLAIDLIGARPVPSPGADLTQAFAARLTRGQDFEREADYLGLYLYARTNPDLAAIEAAFEALGNESPLRAWRARSHPNLAERVAAIERTRVEIAVKMTSGEDLIPEGFTPPR